MEVLERPLGVIMHLRHEVSTAYSCLKGCPPWSRPIETRLKSRLEAQKWPEADLQLLEVEDHAHRTELSSPLPRVLTESGVDMAGF